MKRLTLIASLLLVFSLVLYGQSNFNIEAYRQFLKSHQNLSTKGLLSMHPSGTFLLNINTPYNDSRLFSRIDSFYSLTNFEKELLNKHGFMVSERLKKISFGESLMEIFHADIPVFVSVDAILHAFHISYDRILIDVEIGLIYDKLKQLLQTLHSNQNLLATKYGSNPQMQIMLNDVDVYLTIACRLMNLNVAPYYSQNSTIVNKILNLISNEQPTAYNLFSDNCRIVDWSQFKPRGHYANNQVYPQLANYFRTMMWLGRTEFYLLQPGGVDASPCHPSIADIQRQTIDALLINELIYSTSSKAIYDEIETALKIFAGDQDNITLDNLSYLKTATSVTNADELLNFSKFAEFQDTLRKQSFAYQLILSQILLNDPITADSISPASSFLLFGQRFVIDSYVTASVVYDRIKYYNRVICRLYPSTLDVLFSLGNDAAAQLLINELNQYNYSSNLAALRHLIDSYDNDFWTSNIYSYWLKMIRDLNPPSDRSSLPEFMQTAAYWQQKMNSQLSSWTELRHDNILYAKQSYTGGTVCSFPYSYVEPFPEFYSTIKEFALNAKDKINLLNFSDNGIKSIIMQYLDHLFFTSDTLQTISTKELNGIMLTQNEISFLQRMIYNKFGSGKDYDGWYPKLFYSDFAHGNKGLIESDHIVADIHTTPTDCYGSKEGWISHVGTGYINIGIFITPWVDGELTAFAGPVMSYYEYRTKNFLRLSDDEWKNVYLQSALRPDWVNLYLADSSGNSRGSGPKLLTSEKDDFNNSIVDDYEIKIANLPNPFNSSTLIVFTVPVSLTNQNVNLRIFDLNGNLVSELVNQTLSSGNYIYRWDAKNSAGQNVASGIYFYNIQIADRTKTGKMTLIK